MDEHQVRAMEMEAGDRDTCELDISQDCHPLQSTSATQGSPRESSQAPGNILCCRFGYLSSLPVSHILSYTAHLRVTQLHCQSQFT